MEDKKEKFARCKKCNRILKNQIAIDRGYGSGCFKILGLEPVKKDKYKDYKTLDKW